jgi:hypothetical protein
MVTKWGRKDHPRGQRVMREVKKGQERRVEMVTKWGRKDHKRG